MKVNTHSTNIHGQFSPGGQWVAHQTNESGRFEIVVQSFPAPAGKWQVSTGGGIQPRWRADGKELYFIAPDEKLWRRLSQPRTRHSRRQLPSPYSQPRPRQERELTNRSTWSRVTAALDSNRNRNDEFNGQQCRHRLRLDSAGQHVCRFSVLHRSGEWTG